MRTTTEQLALALDTFSHYAVDPSRRGLNSPDLKDAATCAYLTKDGQRRCALGRHFRPTVNASIIEGAAASPRLSVVIDADPNHRLVVHAPPLDDLLVDSARGFPQALWRDLQHWHDAPLHWNEGGLTPAGAHSAANILTNIADGLYSS
jgi:hypothetical protein